MNLNWLIRRNRFKSRATSRKAAMAVAGLRRRLAHVRAARGARGADLAALWRRSPGRSTGRCRSFRWTAAFQRVSPGQIEKARRALRARRASCRRTSINIQRAVEALPWVDHARIQRRWPNSLHVTVIEQTAAARWGESGLLNTRGELFVRAAAHVPAELPRLSGPEGTECQVAQRYMASAGPDAGGGHAHRGAAPR